MLLPRIRYEDCKELRWFLLAGIPRHPMMGARCLVPTFPCPVDARLLVVDRADNLAGKHIGVDECRLRCVWAGEAAPGGNRTSTAINALPGTFGSSRLNKGVTVSGSFPPPRMLPRSGPWAPTGIEIAVTIAVQATRIACFILSVPSQMARSDYCSTAAGVARKLIAIRL